MSGPESEKTEEWRVIPEFPDYSASSLGRIRRDAPDRYGRFAGLIMKQQAAKGQWLCVSLVGASGKKHRHTVARLVCMVFHGPNSDCSAFHIDGDATNNRQDNLGWQTHVDQTKKWLIPAQLNFDKPLSAKLSNEEVTLIANSKEGSSLLANKYGVSRSTIQRIRSRDTWKHLGAKVGGAE